MCPVCLATAAIVAGGTAGSGGLTALTIGLFRRKNRIDANPKLTPNEEIHHGDDDRDKRASESGFER